MSKRSWAIVALVMVGLGVAVRLTATAQVPKPPEVPFKGKVVAFTYTKHPEKTIALQDPSIKRLGEVDFLTGLVAGSTDAGDWRMGAVVWIPLIDVREMVEFKDIREARRVLPLRQ